MEKLIWISIPVSPSLVLEALKDVDNLLPAVQRRLGELAFDAAYKDIKDKKEQS